MVSLNVKSVAVIGGGPGGIASVYELLHTEKGGTSTITTDSHGSLPNDPQFTKIVAFEQKDKTGGCWNPQLQNPGLRVPPQDLLDTEHYDDPEIIDPTWTPPSDLSQTLVNSPLKVKHDSRARKLQWAESGVFEKLYTNVPSRFTRFSYMPFEDKYKDQTRTIYPFMSQVELCNRIQGFVKSQGLDNYFRFNSRVEQVVKTESGKWRLRVRKVNDDYDEWYEEEFDAVIAAIGHFSVPVYPHIPGLSNFNKNHPGVVSHAKSYRSHDEFVDKDVLVVGGGVSAINTIQYCFPYSKSFTVSLRSKNEVYEWVNEALSSEGIQQKPEIEEIDGTTGDVKFKDGSVGKYDKIVFSTGYHFNFPFYKGLVKYGELHQKRRISGFYYNTFNVDDPTIAAVGITTAPMTFYCIESSAAAIAGVFSGATQLPSKEEQLEWERQRLTEAPSRGFNVYQFEDVQTKFINPLTEYFPRNRRHPLYIDRDHVNDIALAKTRIPEIFQAIKTGKLKVEDTLYV